MQSHLKMQNIPLVRFVTITITSYVCYNLAFGLWPPSVDSSLKLDVQGTGFEFARRG